MDTNTTASSGTSIKELYTTRTLFGGAILASLPVRFEDVSKIRQVPDNQEAFTDVNTDQSIIIELLAYEEEVKNENSGAYFFNDLAESNDATGDNARILKVAGLDQKATPYFGNNVYKSVLLGEQLVSKYAESERNKIQVILGNIRLPEVSTDILLTINDPVIISNRSSSRANVSGNTGGVNDSAEVVMMQLLSSLQIKNWSLFQ